MRTNYNSSLPFQYIPAVLWVGEGLAQQRRFTIWGKDLFAAAAAEVAQEFWLSFAGETIPVLSIISISDRM
jgi:S-adenosylmethionine hydrolase